MEPDRARAEASNAIETKKRPAGLRAQCDMTISPVLDLQSTVKQECCAILCDVAQDLHPWFPRAAARAR